MKNKKVQLEKGWKKITKAICSFLKMISSTLFVCFFVNLFNSLLELLPSKSIK